MKSLAIVLALLPLAASAATITVNTTADNTAADGRCTLREAIANANAAADTTNGDCTAGSGTGDTIKFGFAMPAKIRLGLGELLIQRDVSITNFAPGSLHIDGTNKVRVFEIAAGTTHMGNLAIEHGSADHGGGVLVNQGATLTMENCVLTGNEANAGGLGHSLGGGIYNAGTLDLTDCRMARNTATFDGQGGAIANVGGTMTLTRCTILRNKVTGISYGADVYGGGIHNEHGSVRLTSSTIAQNGASAADNGFAYGGALSNFEGAVVLENCTVVGNRAFSLTASGGAIYNLGFDLAATVAVTNSTLAGNAAICRRDGTSEGGAILNAGDLSVSNSTLARNWVVGPPGAESYGGAIYDEGSLVMVNCTLTRNRTQTGNGYIGYITFSAGGAIYSNGFGGTLTNCTVSGNTSHRANGYYEGGGSIAGGPLGLTNTIVTNSGAAGNCEEGSVDSGGHNISSDGTCFMGGGSDLVTTRPQLAPLADNGGPTKTMALCTAAGMPVGCRAASPAIEAGDNAVTGPPDNLTTDQRGLPRLSGAHVDIGAYESQP